MGQAPDFPPLHDRDALLSLHRSLIEIPSVSGDEHAVGNFLKEYLESQNLTVEFQKVDPYPANPKPHPRHNLLAYPASHRQTRVLLTSHIDTVPPFINYSLSDTNAANSKIQGRGANDDKGAVAAQARALVELLADGAITPADASLLLVVGEEVDGDGMEAVNDLALSWDAVIFGEPTELKLVTGHKGLLCFVVHAHGKAAHSGYPWKGKSAISMLLPALVALDALQLPSDERLGPTTVNIGRVEGGVARNVVPEEAMAEVAIRLAGASVEEAMGVVERTVKGANAELEIEFLAQGYPPVYCDAVEGFETMTVNYGTDVPHLQGRHKRYLYGAGSITTAHSAGEFVYADDLVMAARGYKKLVLEALKAGKQE